jgi:hypothetical protein
MEFKCNHCKKLYKSYQSRWNHINKIHKSQCNPNVNQSNPGCNPNVIQSNPKHKMNNKQNINIENKEDSYNCVYCNKKFQYRQGKWKHEKICKEKDNKTDEIKKLKEEMHKQLEDLKDLIQKSMKIHPKTLQKINNQLNNNGIINNNIVIQVGNEDFNKVLSEKEKIYLLNKYANSVIEMVKMVHISDKEKFKPYKSMYITNLQNNVAYKYDEGSKKFIAVTKSELLDSIIDNRLADIENFHQDYKEKITAFTSKQITKFIERMTDEKEYKDIKKEEIKFAIYNGREEIIQQIKENNPDLNIFT